jgi:hypothetical protein
MSPNTAGTASRKSLASLICGLVSLVTSCTLIIGLAAGITGLILGISVLGKSDQPPADKNRRGMAVTGIVFSSLGCLLSLVMPFVAAGLLLSANDTQQYDAQQSQDMQNLRQIAIAYMTYTFSNQDQYPEHVADLVGGPLSDSSVFVSPYNQTGASPGPPTQADRTAAIYRYGDYVFIRIDEPMDQINDHELRVLAYSALIDPSQHERSVVFLDGHVEVLADVDLDALPFGYESTEFDDVGR